MAKFHNPQRNPFLVPQPVGAGDISSAYLFNQYRVDWTPSKWREAINQAMQYSNLVQLDALYSWCVQSSPFLNSQIQKRLVPLFKRNFAIKVGGEVSKDMTDKYITNSWWFQNYMRYVVLSKFYGVKVFTIDPKKRKIVDLPLRNIDIFNRGLREGTYQYYNIVNAEDYDNLFYIQPETDQDFQLGLLQPISRAMVGIVQMYNVWFIAAQNYSRPFTTLGFNSNNDKAKDTALQVAQNIDMMNIPIIPFTQQMGSDKNSYQVEVSTASTNASEGQFRSFKEYIAAFEAEIMQLVTGGTLLGATEKNTNSEQLASIHLEIYRDILDADAKFVLQAFNDPQNLEKLSKLFGDKEFMQAELVEIPDNTVSQKLFVEVGTMLAKQGGKFTPEAFEKVGLSAEDIDFEQPKEGLLSGLLPKKAPKKEKGENKDV